MSIPSTKRGSLSAWRMPALSRGSLTPTKTWLHEIFEVIPGRLSFSVHSSRADTYREIDKYRRSQSKKFLFSTDFHEWYKPLCLDFGPVNLGVVHQFCSEMRKFWSHRKLQDRELVYYTEDTHENRTNSAFLLAAFLVVDLGFSPENAMKPFDEMPPGMFSFFRDATYCTQTYGLSILACLKGLKKAMTLGWYSPCTFCPEEYKVLDDNLCINVVSPKFMAFKGPVDLAVSPPDDEVPQEFHDHPGHYVGIFHQAGVTAVVRLNEVHTYDSQVYTGKGINHYDIYFDDCTIPDHSVVERFLDAAEKESGMLAVHCRAGLGRTGTLIACHFMKHHGFTASEAIGWLRIVRPGSVIGVQQQFLHWYETKGHCPKYYWDRCVTLRSLLGNEDVDVVTRKLLFKTDHTSEQHNFDPHEIEPISYDPKTIGQMVAQAQVGQRSRHASNESQREWFSGSTPESSESSRKFVSAKAPIGSPQPGTVEGTAENSNKRDLLKGAPKSSNSSSRQGRFLQSSKKSLDSDSTKPIALSLLGWLTSYCRDVPKQLASGRDSSPTKRGGK